MDDVNIPAFLVQSAEDLILSKLAWYRARNEISDRQWNDILAVLKLHELSLDFEYLQHWAQELDVRDLLERAFDHAGLADWIDSQD